MKTKLPRNFDRLLAESRQLFHKFDEHHDSCGSASYQDALKFQLELFSDAMERGTKSQSELASTLKGWYSRFNLNKDGTGQQLLKELTLKSPTS